MRKLMVALLLLAGLTGACRTSAYRNERHGGGGETALPAAAAASPLDDGASPQAFATSALPPVTLASVPYGATPETASAWKLSPETMSNAKIASDYVVTTRPKPTAGCPALGSLTFYPYGKVTGTVVLSTVTSKFAFFTGAYAIGAGNKISFTSQTASVPLANLSGVVGLNACRRCADSLVLTTASAACAQQVYGMAKSFEDE